MLLSHLAHLLMPPRSFFFPLRVLTLLRFLVFDRFAGFSIYSPPTTPPLLSSPSFFFFLFVFPCLRTGKLYACFCLLFTFNSRISFLFLFLFFSFLCTRIPAYGHTGTRPYIYTNKFLLFIHIVSPPPPARFSSRSLSDNTRARNTLCITPTSPWIT